MAVRSSGTGLQLAAKYFALVHLAQREAIRRHPAPAEQVAAAAYAGHAVLTRLFPLLSVRFDAAMPGYTAGLEGNARANLARAAHSIAQQIVANRCGEGGGCGAAAAAVRLHGRAAG